jgi:ABC-type transport system involved in multi-copper enzyme maturation permease subunit
MIAHVMRLTQWEWFKLRGRWMPWIMLAIAVVLAQLGMWFAYAAYHNETLQEITSGGSSSFGISEEMDGETIDISVSCISLANEGMPPEIEKLPEDLRTQFIEDVERFRDESCADTALREDLRKTFTIPHSLARTFTGLVGFAPILIIILAASLMGAEYGWGTLRTTLTRGTGRWQLLASKLVLVLLVCAAGFIVVAVFVAIASLIAAVIPPDEVNRLDDAGKWSDISLNFGKAVYALAPYIALGTFLAVLAQSSAAGISIALGYYVIELIASPLLNITSWGENIADFLLGNNVNEWMQSAVVEVEISDASSAANQPDTLQAFLVILAYTAVLCAAAFWIFLRRDIAGARGD